MNVTLKCKILNVEKTYDQRTKEFKSYKCVALQGSEVFNIYTKEEPEFELNEEIVISGFVLAFLRKNSPDPVVAIALRKEE